MCLLAYLATTTQFETTTVIAFYVYTVVEVSCAYDSRVVVNADGFWIIQEDAEATGDAKAWWYYRLLLYFVLFVI